MEEWVDGCACEPHSPFRIPSSVLSSLGIILCYTAAVRGMGGFFCLFDERHALLGMDREAVEREKTTSQTKKKKQKQRKNKYINQPTFIGWMRMSIHGEYSIV